ncbi:50S ribosomal protein L22 [Candidatus Adlerbacteria bacterium RIFCSPLOWO2_01_FULL_51_16]|uniref:Large ribosomal subunit protein uL22 n=1 Tax=Candidatus Adlerbacteria bacterium RIFCSPLOWO2_01_FULL_51_16 TaxID=1797243 RepID=A0A1F4XHP4_9BACT|nr:MAG: 50S ribosomal protein L22 [Candidatus Adlerbacteria bacterium RIFCSPLOWO2_01_FULL_51_16]
MANASAKLSNYRQSPRKVRLVADLVRGKRTDVALALLTHLPKRAAEPMAKLIRSALANARSKHVSSNELVISRIEVGQGIVFKRFMPRARGKASPIRKKTSHITLELSQPAPAKK